MPRRGLRSAVGGIACLALAASLSARDAGRLKPFPTTRTNAPAAETNAPATANSAAAQAEVVELHIDSDINPVLAEYLGDGIDRANREHAALVLITMDTPGGLDTSMRDIIQHIIGSRTPVCVYVTPSGARAASAGFFILLSADVAAMAPGTHTGAASPLLEVGGYPVTADETLEKKILNDATAYLRSVAGRRGRNVSLAETAVTDAKAFTETEALDGHLVDMVALTPAALLAQLNGRAVTRFDGTTTTLDLANPTVVEVDMSARQRFLERIVQPDVFFILLIVGVLGLYTEFTHPGMFAPGVLGGIALLLALFAMHLLPVNLTGLLLIFLALVLFVLEAKYPTHGILGLGGVVSMLIGALMLIRSPITGAGVTLGVAAAVTLPFAVIAVFLMRLVLRSRAWAPQTGIEEIARETGEVTQPILGGTTESAFGQVFVHGEIWRAASAGPIPAGTHVRVLRADGLTLYVEPVAPEARATGT